jgi:hypothetical protein
MRHACRRVDFILRHFLSLGSALEKRPPDESEENMRGPFCGNAILVGGFYGGRRKASLFRYGLTFDRQTIHGTDTFRPEVDWAGATSQRATDAFTIDVQ